MIKKESCPICWCEFSQQVLPTSLPCGHTFCSSCSKGIKSCSLCRKKLVTTTKNPVNYALLSMLDKVDGFSTKSTYNKATQTEDSEITLSRVSQPSTFQPLKKSISQEKQSQPFFSIKTNFNQEGQFLGLSLGGG